VDDSALSLAFYLFRLMTKKIVCVLIKMLCVCVCVSLPFSVVVVVVVVVAAVVIKKKNICVCLEADVGVFIIIKKRKYIIFDPRSTHTTDGEDPPSPSCLGGCVRSSFFSLFVRSFTRRAFALNINEKNAVNQNNTMSIDAHSTCAEERYLHADEQK